MDTDPGAQTDSKLFTRLCPIATTISDYIVYFATLDMSFGSATRNSRNISNILYAAKLLGSLYKWPRTCISSYNLETELKYELTQYGNIILVNSVAMI